MQWNPVRVLMLCFNLAHPLVKEKFGSSLSEIEILNPKPLNPKPRLTAPDVAAHCAKKELANLISAQDSRFRI